MSELDPVSEFERTREEIAALQRRLEFLERRIQRIPNTSLLDQSFIARAFAVAGHNFFGSLIISIILGVILLLFKR